MRKTSVVALWLIALGACAAFQPQTREPQSSASVDAVKALRLPTQARPLAYTLELSVLPKQERFTGRTQISVELSAASDRVWLHGLDLHVSSVHAVVLGQFVRGTYRQENADGLASLHFERALPAGRHLLELRYDAAFDRKLQGLFRVDTQGESYAFTQFEALSARRAFPCFDEPGFKTPFDIWLTVERADVAVSNTRALSEEQAGAYKRIRFARTKPLPTYLVALAVGPLDIVESAPLPAREGRPEPVPLRGIATKQRGPMLGTALSMLAPMLSTLEDYFGVPYPYDKLDIVAVPDFGPGAMENAGLVTFRDSLLLLDPQRASESERRRSAFVIAHELAHQWVGDLVTMRFWDDIWLNEAFATWLQFRVLGHLHPEFNAELELVHDVQDAMLLDGRVTARMIRQPITSTHDILNAFDGITYAKGGGVIAMFERYLGGSVFQQGMQAYMREHAFGHASTEDLLQALSDAAGRDVTQPFLSFLTQPGVPLIEAQLSCERGQPAQLKLHQTRYLPLGSAGDPKQTWQIPVCARYEVAGLMRESCGLLSASDGALTLDGKGCPSWVMPNADGAGYYRFRLASADLEHLLERGWSKLSARERYVLLQALIAGFSADTVSAAELLGSMPKFAADEERVVALLPLGQLRYLREHWLARAELSANARTVLSLRFSGYVRGMYGATAQRLGLVAQKGESGDTRLMRAQVLTAMCDLANDIGLRTALARLGRQYLGLDDAGATNTTRTLHPELVASELQDLAVRMLVEQGDDAIWHTVYQRFTETQDATERARYLGALAAVRDTRASAALNLVLDPTLRVNEVMLPLRQQLADYRTRPIAYNYFEQHFDQLSERLSPEAMGSTPWLAVGQCDQAQAARIHAFFAPRIQKLPGGPRSLGGALEALGLCDALFKAQNEQLDAYFSKL